MKTATIRDVRQHFGRLLEWIESGEEVEVTRRRKVVARIVPIAPSSDATLRWPDFSNRQAVLFGSSRPKKSLIEGEREDYQW